MLLANLTGFVPIGEARFFWEYVRDGGHRCGCREPLVGCAAWEPVVRALSASREVDMAEAARLARSLDRTRTLLLPWRRSADGGYRKLAGFTATLYETIWRLGGAGVIVDSSKVPSHLRLLEAGGRVDLRVLHLVRDGRAVAHSWSRRSKREVVTDAPGPPLPRRSILSGMARWVVENAATESLCRQGLRHTTMRFEELAVEPASTLAAALVSLGLEAAAARLTELGGSLRTAATHGIGGNPVRFAPARPVDPSEATKWRREMPRAAAWSLGCLVAPLLWRYGYEI